MKQSVNFYQFANAFANSDRANQFSRDALSAIFDWIENYEDDTGEETELDIIAICCDWSEESPEEIAENYGIDVSTCAGRDEIAESIMDYLQDNAGAAISLDNSKIVYLQF
jgi:hypothetical protein